MPRNGKIRIDVKDVINMAWIMDQTRETLSRLAWNSPFPYWIAVVFLGVMGAIIAFCAAYFYTVSQMAVVASALVAILTAAFALSWQKKRVGKSREMNREYQLYLIEYKDALRAELNKNLPEKELDALRYQQREVQALCGLIESKFRGNVVASEAFRDSAPEEPLDDPHFAQHFVRNERIANRSTIMENGHVPTSHQTGA